MLYIEDQLVWLRFHAEEVVPGTWVCNQSRTPVTSTEVTCFIWDDERLRGDVRPVTYLSCSVCLPATRPLRALPRFYSDQVVGADPRNLWPDDD